MLYNLIIFYYGYVMKLHDYDFDTKYEKSVAYFSMEFAIHQALKIYSGGLGFLAGSHMRSAFSLGQNIVGVGILWSYGYYDQTRNEDRSLKVEFIRKYYSFLDDLGIVTSVNVHGKEVKVKAYYLRPSIFHSAPLILLSTDIEENDFLSRTITQKLYDANEETRVSQEIVLGIGGLRALKALQHKVDIYHLNEGHALPLAYELYAESPSVEAVRKKLRFTTHTPEDAGNEEHELEMLYKFGFFGSLSLEEVHKISACNTKKFNLTLGALCLAGRTNAVSKMHGEVAQKMWSSYEKTSPIISITNAQDQDFWMDKPLLRAFEKNSSKALMERKKHLKRQLFNIVADQTGKMFDDNVLTLVWARRFAEYKRPDLIKRDFERFLAMLENVKQPVQIIWAGKPYPFDFAAMNMFNELVHISHKIKNMAVLIGYELDLSRALKCGADVWLNTPRVSREASGTSGMSAAMNGAIHLSTNDGWHREFAKEGLNAFTINESGDKSSKDELDDLDAKSMMQILQKQVIPLYYEHPRKWVKMMKNSMQDVIDGFDSKRMADEYYVKMYI